MLGIAHRVFGRTNQRILEVLSGLSDETHSRPFRVWIGPTLVVGISDPDNICALFESFACLHKPQMLKKAFYLHSLLATDQPMWKKRDEFRDAVGARMLSSYLPEMARKAALLAKNELLTASDSPTIAKEMFKCVIDSTTATLFGTETNAQSVAGGVLYDILNDARRSILQSVSFVWWEAGVAHKASDKLSTEMVAEFLKPIRHRKRTEIEKIDKNSDDYLKSGHEAHSLDFLEQCLWLEDADVLSDAGTLDHLGMALATGLDVTNAIFSVLLMLAIHPEQQAKTLQEILSVAKHPISDLGTKQLTKLKHLDCVLKETLRLFPMKPIVSRLTSQKVQLIDATLSGGTMVVINIANLHRNPTVWGANATQFDPRRFYDSKAPKSSYSYMPFSTSFDGCIGAEYAEILMKTILVHLLHKYEFATELRLEDIHFPVDFISKYPLQIKKRNCFDS